jgi:hypothetical protein
MNTGQTNAKQIHINCYTDASYCNVMMLSVIGIKIGNKPIYLEQLPNVKNTEAEIYAINKCIELCSLLHFNALIYIYTDCQKAFQLENLSENVLLIKIKGHKKKNLKDTNDIIFSSVDKMVRKRLRIIRKNRLHKEIL